MYLYINKDIDNKWIIGKLDDLENNWSKYKDEMDYYSSDYSNNSDNEYLEYGEN